MRQGRFLFLILAKAKMKSFQNRLERLETNRR